jgi:hypothetical protein
VSDLSFEERINQVLDKRLRDQTTLPAEFRSWLPKFIEIQDIRLPISQVSGANLTGESVEDLGGDVHGRVGMVRAGTDPYDFVQLTFDAVYDKWVSPPFVVFATLTGDTTTATTYTTRAELPPIPWEVLDTAGLKPQFRLTTMLLNGNALYTTTLTLGFCTWTTAGSASSIVDSSWSLEVTGTTVRLRDSAFQDLPVLAADDFLQPLMRLRTNNAAGTASFGLYIVTARWVSKD